PSATQPAEKGATFWQAKPRGGGEKNYWLEIDLRNPTKLGKLIWGTGTEPAAILNAPTAMRITLVAEGVNKTINVTGPGNATGNSVDLGGIFARKIRIDFDKFNGSAPAIGQLIVTDNKGAQLVPTGVDPSLQERKGVLEFMVGQTVSARYMDEINETPGVPTPRESRRLGVRYHDASISVARAVTDDLGRITQMHVAWRLDRDGIPQVIVNDPDMDSTTKPDKIKIEVFTEAGDHQEMELAESGNATGSFSASLPISADPAALKNPELLYLRPGDLLWISYLDEHNLNPGYRTFRANWIGENRPTAAEFLPLTMLTTAWPFEVKPSAEGEMRIVPRQVGQGRVNVSVRDPDTFADSSQTAPMKATSLVGGTQADFMLSATQPGTGSKTLDLVLGDADVDRRLDEEGQSKNSGAAELSVVGDDLVRLAYTDAHVATNDMQIRPVIGEAALKAMQEMAEQKQKQPAQPARADAAADDLEKVLPLITLRDPNRRITAEQDARLGQFKTELNRRLGYYLSEKQTAQEYRDRLAARLAAAKALLGAGENHPTTAPAEQTTAFMNENMLQGQIKAADAELVLLKARIDRLAQLGAVARRGEKAPQPEEKGEQPKKLEPAKIDPAKAIVDGPLIPGRAFEVVVDDPDLAGDTVDLRLRSLAGRMVDTFVVAAKRQENGTYRASVETE
ncbi:MAG TPA: hypothetical protein VIL86_06970, partial [Tepidisphaeraceae bacterium]